MGEMDLPLWRDFSDIFLKKSIFPGRILICKSVGQLIRQHLSHYPNSQVKGYLAMVLAYSTAFSPAMRPLFTAKPMVLPGRTNT
jgi:hypothetical protein